MIEVHVQIMVRIESSIWGRIDSQLFFFRNISGFATKDDFATVHVAKAEKLRIHATQPFIWKTLLAKNYLKIQAIYYNFHS